MHISYAYTNTSEGKLESIAIYHLLDNVVQDAQAIVALMKHTLTVLHARHNIKKAFFRSDNAGCYKSATLIASIPRISAETGVYISRYTFSEAQAGKAACDRMAALGKRYIRNYVNSGNHVRECHDIIRAFDAATLLGLCPYGVSIARVQLNRGTKKHPDYRGISVYTDFEFSRTSSKIKAWRHFGIGDGVYLKEGETDKYDESTVTAVEWSDTNSRTSTSGRRHGNDRGLPGCSTLTYLCVGGEEDDKDTCPADGGDDCDRLFECPAPGCMRSFKREHELAKHVLVDRHTRDPDSETMLDYVAHTFIDRVEKLDDSQQLPEIYQIIKDYTVAADAAESSEKPLEEGHANKLSPKRTPISTALRDKMTKWFDEGVRTGTKMTAPTAVKLIRELKDETTGQLLFKRAERLNAIQVMAFWTRLRSARQEKGAATLVEPEEPGADVEVEEDEHAGQVSEISGMPV